MGLKGGGRSGSRSRALQPACTRRGRREWPGGRTPGCPWDTSLVELPGSGSRTAGLEASPWVPRSLDSPDCPSAAAATPNFKVSKRGPCLARVPSTCLFLSPPASLSGPCFLGGQLSSSVGVADHCFQPPVPVPAGPPAASALGDAFECCLFPRRCAGAALCQAGLVSREQQRWTGGRRRAS